jgi:hypothetical protein
MPIMADLPPIPSSAIYGEERRPAIVLSHRNVGYSAITPGLPPITRNMSFASLTDAFNERLASDAIQQLQRYARFRLGWDGYNGVPFQRALIDSAISLTEFAASVAQILSGAIDAIIPGPASDGSIDIEFRSGAKTMIVTMYPNEPDVEIYREDADRVVDEKVRNEPAALAPHLAWLAY